MSVPSALARPSRRAFARARTRRDRAWSLGLAAVAFAACCAIFHRTSIASWGVPVGYKDDSDFVLGVLKSVMDGQYWPLLPKGNHFLGAPHGATWDDFPIPEDAFYFFWGTIGRLIGLFPAANLALFTAPALSALVFYRVARHLRWNTTWAAALAIVYALSPFFFARGLKHLVIAHTWFFPLAVLASAWLASAHPLPWSDRRLKACIALAGGVSLLNVYHLNFFLQVIVLGLVAHVVRVGHVRFLPRRLTVIGAAALGFVLMNADTVVHRARFGPNIEASYRSLTDMEAYSLRPADLVIPPATHRSATLAQLRHTYANASLIPGEGSSPYLGIVGVLLGLWLLGYTIQRAMRGRLDGPAKLGLLAVWLTGYACVGGLNSLMFLFGFRWFRSVNRISVVVLTIVMLVGVRQLGRLTATWAPALRWALAAAVVLLAMWDQLPPFTSRADLAVETREVTTDRAVVEQMEHALPAGALVFELPVMKFPEVPYAREETPYENFRPYFYSHQLRYSYGDVKGRGRETWQFSVATMPFERMEQQLRSLGFAAVLVNRRGVSPIEFDGLARQSGTHELLSAPGGDLVCIVLGGHPASAMP